MVRETIHCHRLGVLIEWKCCFHQQLCNPIVTTTNNINNYLGKEDRTCAAIQYNRILAHVAEST